MNLSLPTATSLDPERLQAYHAKLFRTRRWPVKEDVRFDPELTRDDITVRGHRVAVYRSSGQGAPVLVVHGAMGRALQFKSTLAALMAAGHEVVTFDLPGHGQSEGDAVDTIHVSEVLAALGRRIGPLHAVLAHSFGGIASAYAIANGLLDTRHYVSIGSPSSQSYLLEKIFGMYGVEDAYKPALVEMHKEVLGDNFIVDLSPCQLLPRIVVPMLLVHDRADNVIDFAQFEELAECAKGRAQTLVTSGLAHTGHLGDSATLDALLRFLAPAAQVATA